jgi:lipoprotein-anchoring transpeptidase ErfK/SrfK
MTASTRSAAGSLVRRRSRVESRVARLFSALIAVLLLGACGSAGTTRDQPSGSAPTGITVAGAGQPGTESTISAQVSSGSSLVATALGSRVVVRSGAGSGAAHTLANPTSDGAPLTFLVINESDAVPGWLRVNLPQRPNGSTGWVRESDVNLSSTPYRLIISMSKHRLQLLDQGRRVATYAVGVGKVTTPTPRGTYYLTELLRPPNPAGEYGPYAFGLSAYSNTLKSFAGGPGQLGLHGTDDPKGLGHDVSHGCLRVANAVITKLAGELPLGTPIEIRS